MSYPGTERRRAPRVQPVHECKLALDVSLPVQVLDISVSGVLLASKTVLAVGDRAELHVAIGSRSVRVQVEVCRVGIEANPPRGLARYRAGAIFADMNAEQRLALEQLLGPEPT